MTEIAQSRRRRLAHYLDPKNVTMQPGDEIDAEDCRTELFGKDADKILRAKEEELNQERLQAGRRRPHHNTGTGGHIRRRHASISGDASIIQNLRKNRRR
eukprot:scaffold73305_cov71-Cyclotella_meneghiniana.AAC.2